MRAAKSQAIFFNRFFAGGPSALLLAVFASGLSGCGRDARQAVAPEPAAPAPAPAAEVLPTPDLPAAPVALSTDSELVFRRAFWRRPGPGDTILHAERRESAGDGASVAEWRWFLVLKPSPELRAWLETNPFSLRPVAAPGETATAADRPAWFAPDWKACEVRQNPEGRFILAYAAGENLLYATDSGHGFAPPARAP